MLNRARVAVAVLVGLVALLGLAGCDEEPSGGNLPVRDRAREAVIAAIPLEVAERGVYVYDPAAAQDLFPGTFTGPDLGIVLADADWVAESSVPPLVVASGVGEAELPDGVVEVEGLVIAAVEPADRDAAAARVRAGDAPEGILAELADATAPVSWAGPAARASSAAGDLGDALIHLGGDSISVRVEAPDPDAAAAAMTQELAGGGLPSSPGRRWNDLLVDPQVRVDGQRVVIHARVGDLPALLLRQLIDSSALAFLTSG